MLLTQRSGKAYPFMPSRLDKEFSVLGWFQVTHMWAEKEAETGFIYYAYRLEYIGQEPKWWLPTPEAPESFALTSVVDCKACGKSSPVVFEHGPTCLNRECQRFYSFGLQGPVEEPQYSREFLAGGKVHFDGLIVPPPIFPLMPPHVLGKIGAACPVCRCLSRRRHWARVECENCGWTLGLHIPAYTLEDLATDEANFAKSKFTNGLVAIREISIESWKVTEWLLKDDQGIIIGSISHFVSGPRDRTQVHGANDLLAEIQAANLDLRRNAVRLRGGKCISFCSILVWQAFSAPSPQRPVKFSRLISRRTL